MQANEKTFSFAVEGLQDNGLLQVLSFNGFEAISNDFVFEITLVSKHLRYDVTQLLSKKATLYLDQDDQNQCINGTIQKVTRSSIDDHYAYFKVILTPTLTNLKRRINNRVFTNKTVPEIITIVLNEHHIKEGLHYLFKIKHTPSPRELCTQFEESDYDFINRLCEEIGLFYFFEHKPDNHLLIFTDIPSFPALAEAIAYKSDTGFVADQQTIRSFNIELSACTTQATIRNYNFEHKRWPEGTAQGNNSAKKEEANEPELEAYHYLGATHDVNLQAEDRAKVEIERLRAQQVTATIDGNVTSFHAGLFFSIVNYPRLEHLSGEKPWLINQILHQGFQPQVLEAFGSETSAITMTESDLSEYSDQPIKLRLPKTGFSQGYRNIVLATPQDIMYRPALLHPKPKIIGTQTAIVTGIDDEEIYCDQYGRVKIHYHWDRINPYTEQSSCWVRTVSHWAHKNYGQVIIPRVGMEVVISFLENDPDQPLITGASFNGINKPPYDLPANKTKTVFRTQSTKDSHGFNELSFEDKVQQEQVYLKAERDFDQLTQNNYTSKINNNKTEHVQNENKRATTGNYYTRLEADEHRELFGDRKTQIMGNDYKKIAQSEHTSIGTIQTTEAGSEIHLKAGAKVVISGGMSLTLTAGGQHIVISAGGIFASSPIQIGGSPIAGTASSPIPPITQGDTATPLETIKQMTVTLAPHPNAMGYRNYPYKLYAGDDLLKEGITNNEGNIAFSHIPDIKNYRVELPNGHKFNLNIADPETIQTEDIYGAKGYRSFNQDNQFRLTAANVKKEH